MVHQKGKEAGVEAHQEQKKAKVEAGTMVHQQEKEAGVEAGTEAATHPWTGGP